MFTNEEDSGMKAGRRQLMSQRGCSARASTARSPGGTWDASAGQQPPGLDWCEQPPRKKAKQSVDGGPAAGQHQHQHQHQPPAGQSHKVVEKRRRDRMNQALSSLSKLIPLAYMRQGQSRVEKAEIIELAAQHLLALTWQLRKCQTALGQDYPASEDACCIGKFFQGFREGSRAAIAFLTEMEGYSTTDTLCCRLRAHLHAMAQGYLPSQEELSRPVQVVHSGSLKKQSVEAARSSCYLTDEAPLSCASGTSSEGEDPAGEVSAGASSAAANSELGACRRDPKTSFKLRFQAEARSALEASPLTAAAKASEEEDTDGRHLGDEQLLPGFVLHESGTHYLPLVVPPSALGTEVGSAGRDGAAKTEQPAAGGAPLLHPISIPVNFRVMRFVAPMSRTRQSAVGHEKPAIAPPAVVEASRWNY